MLFTDCGHYGLYLAMLLVAGQGIALAAMRHRVDDAAVGLTAVAVLAVLQYGARRIGVALERLNRATSLRMTSSALLDCFAMLAAIAGVAILVGQTLLAAETSTISPLLPGMVGFILCWYAAMVAVSAQSLQVSVTSDTPVREEALGVLLLPIKIVAQLSAGAVLASA